MDKDSQTFIAYPNDKVTINDIVLKVNSLSSVIITKLSSGVEIVVLPQKRIDDIKL